MKTIVNTLGKLVLFLLLGGCAVHAHDVVVMSPNRPAYEGIEAARQWATLDLTQTHPTMSFEIAELELAGDWAIER